MPAEIVQKINELIPGLLSLLFLVITYYVKVLIAEWKPRLQGMIDANVSANTQNIIKALGRECLAFAEKEFPGSTGAVKLAEATKRFNARALELGLTNLTSDTVRAAIEGAWLEIWGTSPKADAAPSDAISAAQLKQVIDAMAAKTQEGA
jgi:hypothetical protein